jgi:alginate O-acetyltransferase complex protein AlgI
MVFSSLNFLFLFLPGVLAAYFLVPKSFRRIRNLVLLLFSLAFYAYGEPKYVAVMLLSILLNYLFGLLADGPPGAPGAARRRLAAVLAAGGNLAILFYFKYTGFFLENINRLSGAAFALPDIVMPIGISFFTFQGMSYVFYICLGRERAQKNPLNVMLYISLFPQLIAGPIVRYETVAAELSAREENLSAAAWGIARFSFGLGMKVLLANQMGLVADRSFRLNAGEMGAALAWGGAAAYSVQIFFDFSGYSDMAIGLGRIFGFHFLENFNFPYIADSITDFWRRWHISLSTWFRDYVYIPLGGNRVPRGRYLFNVMAVWFLTGFWHGAAWNFVVWGVYFGVIIILEKFFLLRFLEKLHPFFRHLYALVLIVLGWVLFRADGLGQALAFAGAMFGASGAGLAGAPAQYFLRQYWPYFVLCILFSVPLAGRTAGAAPAEGEAGEERRMARGEDAGPIRLLIRNAAALAVFKADHDCGKKKTCRNAGGANAQNALVPIVVRHDDGAVRRIVFQIRKNV